MDLKAAQDNSRGNTGRNNLLEVSETMLRLPPTPATSAWPSRDAHLLHRVPLNSHERLGAVRSPAIDIAHKLWQVSVAEHLPNRYILAGVIPVVIDDALEQRTSSVGRLSLANATDFLKLLDREGVEERINQLCDRPPGLPHFSERWRTGWLTVANQVVEVW